MMKLLFGACALVGLLFCGVAEAGPRKARSAASSAKGLPFSGDINADGKVNKRDHDCLKKFVKPVSRKARSKRKSKPRCMKVPTGHADMNCDGRIGQKDLVIVKKVAKGAVRALKSISPLYKKKGDGFIHQACMDKHWHMPATVETWLFYFNAPGTFLYGKEFKLFRSKDLVAATIQSKDLSAILNDSEKAKLAGLKKAYSPAPARAYEKSISRLRGAIKPGFNHDAMAQKASELLNEVLFRQLKEIQVDGPIFRSTIRLSLVHLLTATYAPETFLHYVAVAGHCTSIDDPCKGQKLNEVMHSSLVRQQMAYKGYDHYNLAVVGDYIASQASPLKATIHIGWVSDLEASFLAALGIDASNPFGLDDIEKAMKALAESVPSMAGGNGMTTNIGSAPAACMNVDALTPGQGAAGFASGLFGQCAAGDGSAGPPGMKPGAGPDPDPTAMPGRRNPAMQEVPVWMDENSPCYGLQAQYLFGKGNSDGKTGEYVQKGTKVAHDVGMGVAFDAGKGASVVGAVYGAKVDLFYAIIDGVQTGNMAKSLIVGALSHSVGALAATVAGPVGGAVAGEAASQLGNKAWEAGEADGPGGMRYWDDNGDMHIVPEEEYLARRSHYAKQGKGFYATEKEYEECQKNPSSCVPESSEGDGAEISQGMPDPTGSGTGNELYQACAKSAAQDLLGCMFPQGGNGDEMGSTSQCAEVCMVAGASASECGGEPTFMACGCAEKAGGGGGQGRRGSSGGGQDVGGDCPSACAHRFVAILGDVDCSNCSGAGSSSPTNLVGLCGQGMIPPGLMKLCGAIDPVSQAGQPARTRKTPALNKNRATRTQMNRQQRNRRTRQTPASSRGNP